MAGSYTTLDRSPADAGRLEASYEHLRLADLTAEVAATCRSSVERAGLDFGVCCLPTRGSAYVDREMWKKIVVNLVSNALNFTHEGRIRVTLSELEGDHLLQVQDTGIGISADELPRIFERFHRVPDATGRSLEG